MATSQHNFLHKQASACRPEATGTCPPQGALSGWEGTALLKARRSAGRKRRAPKCLKSQRTPVAFPKATRVWRASRTVDKGPQAPCWMQTRSATLWWPCRISSVHPSEVHKGSQHPESRMTTPRPRLRPGNRSGRNACHCPVPPLLTSHEGHGDHGRGHAPSADPAVQGPLCGGEP